MVPENAVLVPSVPMGKFSPDAVLSVPEPDNEPRLNNPLALALTVPPLKI